VTCKEAEETLPNKETKALPVSLSVLLLPLQPQANPGQC